MTRTINNILTSIANWNRRHATIRALSGLNDHLLKDIGINRSEIGSIAAGLWHEPDDARVSRPVVCRQVEPSRIQAVRSVAPVKQAHRDRNWYLGPPKTIGKYYPH